MRRTVVVPPIGAKAKGADFASPAEEVRFTVSVVTGRAGCTATRGWGLLWAGTFEML